MKLVVSCWLLTVFLMTAIKSYVASGGICFSGAGLLLTFMVCLGSTQLTKQNFMYKNDEARPRAKKEKTPWNLRAV